MVNQLISKPSGDSGGTHTNLELLPDPNAECGELASYPGSPVGWGEEDAEPGISGIMNARKFQTHVAP